MSAAPATADATVSRQGTTRERLLEAAIEMFAERGYAATGVDALCRRAGVAKTGLYWEFQNKVGLLTAVIDHVVSQWVDQIRDTARTASTPPERLDAALGVMRRLAKERPEIFRVLLVVLAERTQVDEDARHAMRRFFDSAHQALADGIQESVANILPPEELKVACDVILAMMEGLMLRAQVYPDSDLDRLFGTLRKTILLLVRELVANVHGTSTLAFSIREFARTKKP
jgi:AcrR family transcriptional regulator